MPSGDPGRIVRGGYDAIATTYMTARGQSSADVGLLCELLTRLVLGARVLDAGCGSGVPIARLLSRRCQVTGVDFSQAQVDLARQNVPQAEFLCMDLRELDLPDGAFDGIACYYAIIHVPREAHRGILTRFACMLKPGGWLLLCMGAEDLPDDLAEYHGVPMYWSHYDAATNVRMVEECGFRVEWARRVADEKDGGEHLFVLAQRKESGVKE